MTIPFKDPIVPTDKLPIMVTWYRLETSLIAVNLTQMKYVLLTATELEHCASPSVQNCDVRSPVYSMTTRLFMNDTENVKNYCKTDVEPNSVLPRAQFAIDGL